jgi:hypothetical protein
METTSDDSDLRARSHHRVVDFAVQRRSALKAWWKRTRVGIRARVRRRAAPVAECRYAACGPGQEPSYHHCGDHVDIVVVAVPLGQDAPETAKQWGGSRVRFEGRLRAQDMSSQCPAFRAAMVMFTAMAHTNYAAPQVVSVGTRCSRNLGEQRSPAPFVPVASSVTGSGVASLHVETVLSDVAPRLCIVHHTQHKIVRRLSRVK